MRTPTILINTEYRLQQWGRWQRWLLTQGLGYPTESSINKLMKGKGLWIRATASKLSPDDPVVHFVDQTIECLEKQDNAAAKLLYYQYTKRGSLRNKAKTLKMSYSCYREKLYRAIDKIQQALKQAGLA